MDIKWQRGKFIKFFAKIPIRVGGKDSVDKIDAGDEFEYDGSILKFAGAEMPTSSIRGVIAKDWASLTEDDDSPVDAFVATRDVAKSVSINKDLNRVQRGGLTRVSAEEIDEETILTIDDRGRMENAKMNDSPRILTRDDNRRKIGIRPSISDTQEGVTVGRVRSAAKVVVDVSKNPETAGVIENRVLGKPVLKGNIVNAEGMSIRMSTGSASSSIGSAEDGVIVGKVRKSTPVSTGGIEVKDTSRVRAASIVEEAAKPRRAVINTKLPPRIRIARMIDPDFPSDWSFSGKLADRLASVKEHGVTSEFLEALYAAEGDQMRRALEKAYPKHFRVSK